MASSIASSLTACRVAFNELLTLVQTLDDETVKGFLLQEWEDERGRLRMWAGNIGAHKTGESSLDCRLRDSSHVQRQIVKLLNQLFERLVDARTILVDGEESDVESIHEGSSEQEGSPSELDQIRKSISTAITCLFEMSMLARKPAGHDIRVGSKHDVPGEFEQIDQRHIRDKFPMADESLVLRLARATFRRRRYLKYRERHAVKLSQGIDHEAQQARSDGSVILSETVATNVRNWNIDFDETASNSGISQTSYASTLLSGGHITVPAPPKASNNGAPFECPYCYVVITVKSRMNWNRHVFRDLLPYVCTEIDCVTPDRLYSTKHEWVHHLRTSHGQDISSLPKPGQQTASLPCALCGKPQSSWERLVRHLAQHLQELALFVLPRDDEDFDEANTDTDTDASSSQDLSVSDIAAPSAQSLPADIDIRNDLDKLLPEITSRAITDGGSIVGHAAGSSTSSSEMGYTVGPGGSYSDDMKTRKSIPRHVCTTCGKVYKRLGYFKKHLQTHNPDPMSPVGAQVKHKRQLTTPEEATHACEICGKLFKRAHNWKAHVKTHDPDRKYPHACTVMVGEVPCTKKFMRKTDLVRHYDSVYLTSRNFQCDLCGDRFRLSDTLRRHIKDWCPAIRTPSLSAPFGEDHTRPPPSLPLPEYLEPMPTSYHTDRRIIDPKPEWHIPSEFRCNICYNLFGNGELLARHARICSEQSPYSYDESAMRLPSISQMLGGASRRDSPSQESTSKPISTAKDIKVLTRDLDIPSWDDLGEREQLGSSFLSARATIPGPAKADSRVRSPRVPGVPKGDAVLMKFLGGLNLPDVAARAGEEPPNSASESKTNDFGLGMGAADDGSTENKLIRSTLTGQQKRSPYLFSPPSRHDVPGHPEVAPEQQVVPSQTDSY
ncbi:MAG: hypothetical protein Q9174_005949, partial [Haloplaca sp. 1 TL-2023]